MMASASSGHPDRLVIYPSRLRMLLVLLGAIGFVALGVWIGTHEGVPIWDVAIALCIGVPFFGACGLYAAYRLVIQRPAVALDSMGITDTASALGVGLLFWEDIDHVRVYKSSGQSFLGIIPRDLEGFLSRQRPLRRRLIELNLRLGFAPVNVPQVVLRMKLDALADLMHARYGVRVER